MSDDERTPAEAAEQAKADEARRQQAKEIVEAAKLTTLDDALRFAQGWVETAIQATHNEGYWHDRAEAAEARPPGVLVERAKAAPATGCICASILDVDSTRHFRECPLRTEHPARVAIAPVFVVRMTKDESGAWAGGVTYDGNPFAAGVGLDGDRALQATKHSVFLNLAGMAERGAKLPPDVEALFALKFV